MCFPPPPPPPGGAGRGNTLNFFSLTYFFYQTGGLLNYIRDISPFREDSYYGYRNRPRFVEKQTTDDEYSWIRPRLIVPNATAFGKDSLLVDHRVYRNSKRTAGPMEVHGPANFNLFDWVVVVIEDWFGFAFGSQADTWFDAVRNWILNDNTDIKQWPDSNGLAFFLRYPFTCHFPENMNCSIGVGFEQAFLWVTVGTIIVFIIGATVFPPIMIPFSILSITLSYIIVLAGVAWFLSPACMFMFPAFPIPFGIALPECAADQLIAFADKWITNCYSPLILPSYMIAGEVCPTDPHQAIDFLNCRDVGVSDGIQNLLYLGFWLFGQGFCDFMMYLTSTTLGLIIPGLGPYMQTTLNDFKMSSDTNKQRLTFCFWATLPTIVFPLTVLFLGGIVVALLIPPLLLLINALVTFFFASPAAVIVPGADASVWFGQDPEVNLNGDEEEEEFVERPPNVVQDSSFRGVINRAIYGKLKSE